MSSDYPNLFLEMPRNCPIEILHLVFFSFYIKIRLRFRAACQDHQQRKRANTIIDI